MGWGEIALLVNRRTEEASEVILVGNHYEGRDLWVDLSWFNGECFVEPDSGSTWHFVVMV
jgi:hypothetical protein